MVKDKKIPRKKEKETPKEQPKTDNPKGEKQEHQEQEPIIEGEEIQESKGVGHFFIVGAIIILAITAFIFIPPLFDDGLVTLDDYHQANLDGKKLDNAYLYNEFSFVKYDGLWYTQIFNQYTGTQFDVPLHYGPKEVTDLIVTGNLNLFFAKIKKNNIGDEYDTQTYLTFDPESTQMAYVALATGELTQNLAKTMGIAFLPACTKEHDDCKDVPIITCDNTKDPVIYIKEAEETAVTVEGNCVIIQGEKEEIVRAADRFLFKLYNIMN